MNKKIIKIIYLLLFIIWIIFTIKFYIIEKKYSDDLQILKEVNSISNVINKYYIHYGDYPNSENNLLINNSILCDLGFDNCGKLFFDFRNTVENNLYYTKVENDFFIQFKTKKDNKYLKCEDKKGCIFSIDSNGVLKKH